LSCDALWAAPPEHRRKGKTLPLIHKFQKNLLYVTQYTVIYKYYYLDKIFSYKKFKQFEILTIKLFCLFALVFVQ